jgi:hypothetical protein
MGVTTVFDVRVILYMAGEGHAEIAGPDIESGASDWLGPSNPSRAIT